MAFLADINNGDLVVARTGGNGIPLGLGAAEFGVDTEELERRAAAAVAPTGGTQAVQSVADDFLTRTFGSYGNWALYIAAGAVVYGLWSYSSK